jgi:hypothetical protein
MQDILAADLSERMYFVTGDLTRELFDDNCQCVMSWQPGNEA